MRITFNPNVGSVAPIKPVTPKYRARSTKATDAPGAERPADVVVVISDEARQGKRRKERDKLWYTLASLFKGSK